VGGALSVWFVRRFAPYASGSGIPQVKSVLARDADPEWKRLLPDKFISGGLGIGGGSHWAVKVPLFKWAA
jgi:CIC family chloride channel protein